MKKNSRDKSNKLDTEAHLRAIIKTAIEGIITIDSNGIVQTVNPAAEKIFSYDITCNNLCKQVHIVT